MRKIIRGVNANSSRSVREFLTFSIFHRIRVNSKFWLFDIRKNLRAIPANSGRIRTTTRARVHVCNHADAQRHGSRIACCDAVHPDAPVQNRAPTHTHTLARNNDALALIYCKHELVTHPRQLRIQGSPRIFRITSATERLRALSDPPLTIIAEEKILSFFADSLRFHNAHGKSNLRQRTQFNKLRLAAAKTLFSAILLPSLHRSLTIRDLMNATVDVHAFVPDNDFAPKVDFGETPFRALGAIPKVRRQVRVTTAAGQDALQAHWSTKVPCDLSSNESGIYIARESPARSPPITRS